MRPEGNGRFCAVCATRVIDFTAMTDAEVQSYFKSRSEHPRCGRFTIQQVDRIRIQLPNYIWQKKWPRWKYFLLVFLFCFGSSLYGIEVVSAQDSIQTVTQAPLKSKPHFKKKKKVKYRLDLKWPEKTDWTVMTFGLIVCDPLPVKPDPGALINGVQSDSVIVKGSGFIGRDQHIPEKPKRRKRPVPYWRPECILPHRFRIKQEEPESK